MELLQPLVAAVGRSGGRARNKRGLTALGEAVVAGHAAAAELLIVQARPGLSEHPERVQRWWQGSGGYQGSLQPHMRSVQMLCACGSADG